MAKKREFPFFRYKDINRILLYRFGSWGLGNSCAWQIELLFFSCCDVLI
nr:MAG TPA: hypothetical protein [Caudoviricetes sp.]